MARLSGRIHVWGGVIRPPHSGEHRQILLSKISLGSATQPYHIHAIASNRPGLWNQWKTAALHQAAAFYPDARFAEANRQTSLESAHIRQAEPVRIAEFVEIGPSVVCPDAILPVEKIFGSQAIRQALIAAGRL